MVELMHSKIGTLNIMHPYEATLSLTHGTRDLTVLHAFINYTPFCADTQHIATKVYAIQSRSKLLYTYSDKDKQKADSKSL